MIIFFAVFAGISLLTRLALLVKAAHDVTWTLSLVAAFAWGASFDLGAAAFASLPLVLLLTFLPAGWFARRWQRALAHVFGFGVIYLLLFGLVAEWTFWDEFGVRFNFIAVDYLVYTTEVIGNIRESYNLPLILGGVFAGAAVLHLAVWRSGLPARWFAAPAELFKQRLRAVAPWFVGALLFGAVLDDDWMPGFNNNFNRELGKNGLWSLFSAFKDNELAYEQFYTTLPQDEAFATVRREIARDTSVTMTADLRDTLHLV
ncbi:MAG: LTA synthase family protein, partial [Opitutus sp.]